MVDRLLQLLRQIDTARGDRIDSNPEIEELYTESIGLQGQINALIKKYSDQKGELNRWCQTPDSVSPLRELTLQLSWST